MNPSGAWESDSYLQLSEVKKMFRNADGDQMRTVNEYHSYLKDDGDMLPFTVSRDYDADSREGMSLLDTRTAEDVMAMLLKGTSPAQLQDSGDEVSVCSETMLERLQFHSALQLPPSVYSVSPTLAVGNTIQYNEYPKPREFASYATTHIPDVVPTRNFPLRTVLPVDEVKNIPNPHSLSTLAKFQSVDEMSSSMLVQPLQNSHFPAEMEIFHLLEEAELCHQLQNDKRLIEYEQCEDTKAWLYLPYASTGTDATSSLQQHTKKATAERATDWEGIARISPDVRHSLLYHFSISEQPEKWSLQSTSNEASSDLPLQPTLTVTNQPPEVYIHL